jgi:hypothetical protein
MRELEHDIHADIDARVDPDYMSPAAMQQRIALIRQWRAEITTLQAVVWNESRTVCRWESNPNLALIVLEQIEDKLRRAAAL